MEILGVSGSLLHGNQHSVYWRDLTLLTLPRFHAHQVMQPIGRSPTSQGR